MLAELLISLGLIGIVEGTKRGNSANGCLCQPVGPPGKKEKYLPEADHIAYAIGYLQGEKEKLEENNDDKSREFDAVIKNLQDYWQWLLLEREGGNPVSEDVQDDPKEI
jgi:hypothetical protein